MKDYNWEKFHKSCDTSGSQYCGVRISPRTLILTKSFRYKMFKGEMDTIGIWFDKEAKAIAFAPNEPTGRSMKKHSGSILIALWRMMPVGRYIFSEEKDGRFICVLKEK